jgi:hypothetical protein
MTDSVALRHHFERVSCVPESTIIVLLIEMYYTFIRLNFCAMITPAG